MEGLKRKTFFPARACASMETLSWLPPSRHVLLCIFYSDSNTNFRAILDELPCFIDMGKGSHRSGNWWKEKWKPTKVKGKRNCHVKHENWEDQVKKSFEYRSQVKEELETFLAGFWRSVITWLKLGPSSSIGQRRRWNQTSRRRSSTDMWILSPIPSSKSTSETRSSEMNVTPNSNSEHYYHLLFDNSPHAHHIYMDCVRLIMPQ